MPVSVTATLSHIENNDLGSLVERTKEQYSDSFSNESNSRVVEGIGPDCRFDALSLGDGVKIGFRHVQQYMRPDFLIEPAFSDAVLHFRAGENALEDFLYLHHISDQGGFAEPYFGNVPLENVITGSNKSSSLEKFSSGTATDYIIELSHQMDLPLRIVNKKEKLQINFTYNGEAAVSDSLLKLDDAEKHDGDTNYTPSHELTKFLDKYKIAGTHNIDDVAKYIVSCEGVDDTAEKISGRISHLAGLLSKLPHWTDDYNPTLEEVSGRLLYTILLPDKKFESWRESTTFSFEELEKVNPNICKELVGKYDETELRSVFELAGYMGMACNPVSSYLQSKDVNLSVDGKSKFEMNPSLPSSGLGGYVNMGRLEKYVSNTYSEHGHSPALAAVLTHMGCPTKFGG